MEDIDNLKKTGNDSEEELFFSEVIKGDVDLFYLDVLLAETFRNERYHLG